MILETKLKNLDNKPIKVNKKSPPRSINQDLTHLYFTAMFIGWPAHGDGYCNVGRRRSWTWIKLDGARSGCPGCTCSANA